MAGAAEPMGAGGSGAGAGADGGGGGVDAPAGLDDETMKISLFSCMFKLR